MTPPPRPPLALLLLAVFTATLPHVHAQCTFDFNDCMDLYQLEINNSDIYIVGSDVAYNRVYCYNDVTSGEGGGWTGVLKLNQTGISAPWPMDTDMTGYGSLYGNFWIGTDALAQMTDVDMVLVVRAKNATGNWEVGLFAPFRIDGTTLSTSMVYLDGNIGLEKSVYDGISLTGACLGFWWYPGCHMGPTSTDGTQTSNITQVEMSIRPFVNDTERACPPLYPFPRDMSGMNMTVQYSQYWRGDGGTVQVTCVNAGDVLVWSDAHAQLLMSGEDASEVPASQTFTCQATTAGLAWSPDTTQMLPDGLRCIAPCEIGYSSNLETGALRACLKFVPSVDAGNLTKAWEICQAEGASPANPFLSNSTLQTFLAVAAQQNVTTSLDKRVDTGILSAGAVNESLIPAVITDMGDCLYFADGQFIWQPCFPVLEPVLVTGVVCQKPGLCPPNFFQHPAWGCYLSMPTSDMTPLSASHQCAVQFGSTLPPATGAEDADLTMPYISTVNRRGDNVTWLDRDGSAVTLQLTTDTDVTKQCLLVQPTTTNVAGSMTAVACDAPLESTAAGQAPSVLCVYPRLTDCSSAPPPPAVLSTPDTNNWTLDATATASCDSGLMFNATQQPSALLTCHGAMGNWLPAQLGDCVTRCGPPPAAPDNSVMSPPEASNQTVYTYTCAAGLQTDTGAPETTLVCQDTGLYQPPLPANCTQCAGFPELDETHVVDMTVTHGTQGQVVTVACSANMSTADGTTSQTVTCGPTGWTPAKLSSCNVCANTPEVDNSSVTVEMPEASTLGNVIIYSCPAGMAFESGARLTSAICIPDGWYSCALGLNCSMCVAEPPAALENMNRTWSSFDQAAEYSCIAPLTMDGVNDTQALGCGLQGWPLTPLLPCDKCMEPNVTSADYTITYDGLQLNSSTLTMSCPAGKVHSNLTADQLFPCTAAGWQADAPLPCDRCAAPADRPTSNALAASTEPGVLEGGTATFNCLAGLATAEGATNFTETCLPEGWSDTGNCTHCLGDPPAQNRSEVRAWASSRAMGATANYTCSSGDLLQVTCTTTGWSSAADPCDTMPMYCANATVEPELSTPPEDSGRGTEPNRTATYRCSNGVTTVLRCLQDGTWSTDQTPCAADANLCPEAPAAPANATVMDYGQYAAGQRNATYTCADGTQSVIYCQNATWAPGVTPCEPGSPTAPPAPPPGVFVTDSGPVSGENGTMSRILTYDCSTGVTQLVWVDGVWTPENAMPCADPKNACPERNTTESNVTFVDTGPYSVGVRNATYNCSAAGLADTFTCINGSWSPSDLAPCDGTVPAPARPRAARS